MMVILTKYLVVLFVVVTANILLGMYNNINVNKIKFDKKKFFKGLGKGVIIAYACYALAFAFYMIPELAETVGIEPKTIIMAAIVIYVLKVIAHLKDIFGIEGK